jgi:hypothetical protein
MTIFGMTGQVIGKETEKQSKEKRKKSSQGILIMQFKNHGLFYKM